MVENMKGETVGSWKLMEKCLDLDLKGSHKWVLIVLCSHYPNIFPSEARIAKDAGISLANAKRALAYLEKEEWITRQRRYSNKTTIYTVHVSRIMATPPRKLTIPTVEGGLPFPEPTPQPIAQGEPSGVTAQGELSPTAHCEPSDSSGGATNIEDNIEVITDNITIAQGELSEDEVPCAQGCNVGSPSAGALSEPPIEDDESGWYSADCPRGVEIADDDSLPAPSPATPSPSPPAATASRSKPAPTISLPPGLHFERNTEPETCDKYPVALFDGEKLRTVGSTREQAYRLWKENAAKWKQGV
jgi:hypothetical protein